MCQSVVAPGQTQPQPLSAKIVNDVDTNRLGALPTAAGWITRLAYAHARQAGIELDPLLKKAGLTDQQIKDRGARFPVHHQIQFLNLAANALGDEFLGFHLAQLPDLRELGLLFYVAASSETLSDALQRAARYSSIGNEGLSLKYLEEEDIRIAFNYVGIARHSDRHQIEFFMTVLIRLCRQLTGLHLVPSRARLTHRRSNQGGSELATYFGGRITFGARADELTFVGASRTSRSLVLTRTLTSFWWRIASKLFLIDRRTEARSDRRSRMQLFRCCRTGRCARRRSPQNSA
jgi:hypothetical protein